MNRSVCEVGEFKNYVNPLSLTHRKRKNFQGHSFVPTLIRCPQESHSADSRQIIRQRVPLKDHTGVSLYLESFRVNDGKEKLPLLMSHGLTYSSHEFDVDFEDYSLVRYFARKGYEVWLVDFAGYGRSDEIEDGFMPDSGYASEDLADAAKVILERCGREKLDLFGWSWGGLVAGKFAVKYPELLRKLVLYAPITYGLREKHIAAPFITNTWAHAADDFQLTENGSMDLDITEQEIIDLYVANCCRFDRDTAPNGGRRELLVGTDKLLLDVSLIKTPTIILCGTKDQYCTLSSCSEAIGKLSAKESRLVIYNGSSHMMMIEKPFYRAFRRDVINFLRS